MIICEGETEEEFIKKTLYSHFISKEILVSPLPTYGIKPWEAIKYKLEKQLKSSNDVFVTTIYDYYGIHPHHKFPKWEESNRILNKNKRLNFLETEMKNSISIELQRRFIPYIQLHEFEGLLFNDIKIFHDQIPPNDFLDLNELISTFDSYPDNPEDINNERITAPSYRLKKIIKGYNKIVYGNILFDEIGLPRVRAKSPRFNNWISELENI